MDQQLLDQLALIFVDAAIARYFKEQALAKQDTCEPAAADSAPLSTTAATELRDVRQ